MILFNAFCIRNSSKCYDRVIGIKLDWAVLGMLTSGLSWKGRNTVSALAGLRALVGERSVSPRVQRRQKH